MCTAVVGGSIHPAGTNISAASDQKTTTPRTSRRIKNRRRFFRGGGAGGVVADISGNSRTVQNNSPVCVAADGDTVNFHDDFPWALTGIYLIQAALRPVLFTSNANFWS